MENGNASTPSGDGWRSDDGTEDLAAGVESPTSDVDPIADDNNTDTPAADPAKSTEPASPNDADGSPTPDQKPDQDASDPNPASPQEGDAEDTEEEGEADELGEEADEAEEDLDDGTDGEAAPQASPRGKQETSPQKQDQAEKSPEQSQKPEGEGQKPEGEGQQPGKKGGGQPNPNQSSSPGPNGTPGGPSASGGKSPEQTRSTGGPKQMRSGSDFKAQSPTHKPSESKSGGAGGNAGNQTKAGAAASKLKDKAKNAAGAKKDNQPKQTAGQKAAATAKAAVTKGVQTALKSAGIVVSAKVAWIIARVLPVISLLSIVLPVILITSLLSQPDEKAELPFDGMLPENTSGLVRDAGVDVLAAATTAAYTYKDPKYGQIPWSLLVALAATTSDIGRVSPWDSCVRGDTEDLLGTAQPGVAEANVVEDCDSDTLIFNEEAGVQGPLLVYTSALQDEALKDVDLDRIDLGPATLGQPTTAVEFIAYELNAIRRQMIDNEGWAAPTEEAVEGNPAYANRFWEEAVSRLPVMDPNYAVCETPEIFVDRDGVAESPEVIAAEITKLWRCELFRAAELEVARAVANEDGTFSYTPIEYRSLAVAEVVREALIVTAEFSEGGTDKEVTGPMACGMIPTGPGVGRFSREELAGNQALQSADPETNAEAKEYQENLAALAEAQISSDEPAGLFPMTEDTFRKYNPVTGAVRCDIGANMHAAVLAYIDNAQPVELAEEEVYTPEMAIGGWAEMPWALGGNDSIEAFKENGYYRLPELSRTCKNSIEDQVANWLMRDGLSIQTGGQTVEVGGGSVITVPLYASVTPNAAVYGILGLEAGGRFPGDGLCQRERLVDDVSYASEVAVGLKVELTTSLEGVDEARDAGYSENYTLVDESGTKSYQNPVEAAVETIVAATTQFAEENRNVNTRGGTARPGQDSVIERLSHTGRQALTATANYNTVTELAKRTVNLAMGIAGLYTGDTRVADEPFLSAASLAGNYTSLFGSAVGSVPDVLIQAVDKAVRNQPGGCGMDAPFLLATAFEETGVWWRFIDPITGTMRNEPGNQAYRNSFGAMGPFQFIQSTWNTHGQDGNGDGVRDVQNVFDAAAGSVSFQCGLAERYSSEGNLSNESVALQVAIDYHDGPGRNRQISDACLSGAQNGNQCAGETYAQKRISRAQEYRRLADMNVPLGAIDVNPDSVNGKVIAFALNQIGKPYCNDGDSCSSTNRATYGSDWTLAGGSALQPGPGYERRFGPDAYDCSGLIVAAYMSLGIDIGAYYSDLQYRTFSPVPRSGISPGDLLFYDRDNNGRIDHVSLYIGDNKMMHASSLERGLLVDNANLDPGRGFVGARRIPGGETIVS